MTTVKSDSERNHTTFDRFNNKNKCVNDDTSPKQQSIDNNSAWCVYSRSVGPTATLYLSEPLHLSPPLPCLEWTETGIEKNIEEEKKSINQYWLRPGLSAT